MAFNFKVYQRTERTELGSIASILGAGGLVAPIAANLKDTTKRVVLVITNRAGESDTVILSAQVSKLFRSKEIKLSQLVGFPIVEQANSNGELMNLVVMPSKEGTQLTQFALDEMKIESYNPGAVEKVSLEDLIAF